MDNKIHSVLINNTNIYVSDEILSCRQVSDLSTVKADFFFSAKKLDFDYISDMLGTQPKKITLAKNIKLQEFQLDSWSYYCDYEISTDINVQIEKVLLPFLDKDSEIKKICEKFNAQLQLTVFIDTNNIVPWLALTGKNIRRMANLGVETFDIDIL